MSERYAFLGRPSGFGVRIRNGRSTWIYQYRHLGRTRRIKIGDLGSLSEESARAIALARYEELRSGLDPSELRRERRIFEAIRFAYGMFSPGGGAELFCEEQILAMATESLPLSRSANFAGIYFLVERSAREIVYVGQSRDIVRRLAYHRFDGRTAGEAFDSFAAHVLPGDPSLADLLKLESRYILEFQPRENATHGLHKVPFRRYDDDLGAVS